VCLFDDSLLIGPVRSQTVGTDRCLDVSLVASRPKKLTFNGVCGFFLSVVDTKLLA